jgi:hypothetical protein
MLIDWLKFLPALVLLLPPVALFHTKRVRYRALSHGWSGYWSRTFSLGLHSIDFGRAMLGAWWLADGISAGPDAYGLMRHGALFIQVPLLALAVTLQTLVSREPGSAHAPLTFVAGLVAGFLPPWIAAFSLLLGIVIAAGLRSPAGFFPLLGACVIAVGLLFSRTKLLPSLAGLACVVALPWMLTLLFPRYLALTYVARRASGSDTSRTL